MVDRTTVIIDVIVVQTGLTIAVTGLTTVSDKENRFGKRGSQPID
jgi:hypothetical protein